MLELGVWMCPSQPSYLHCLCLPKAHAGHIVSDPTLLEMGNISIPEALHVPLPTQPISPSLFSKSNHSPDFTVMISLLFFIIVLPKCIPKHRNLVFALCVCVEGRWRDSWDISYIKGKDFTMSSGSQTWVSIRITCLLKHRSLTGLHSHVGWFSRSEVRTENLHFKSVPKWRWWCWARTTLPEP